jgi:hypothetical protein
MKAHSLSIVSISVLIFFLLGSFVVEGKSFDYPRTPEDVLILYLALMKEHNNNPDLPIYTEQSKQMLKSWRVTPYQMDNMVRTYNSCTPDETKFDPAYLYAVIRYPINQTQCSPWFFKKAGDIWKLDLTMMQNTVRFDDKNRWHFVPGVGHHYGFAFLDWVVDKSGYPTSISN